MSSGKSVRCMASVWVAGDLAAYSVAETPSEVRALCDEAVEDFITLTLANVDNEWNGRPLYLRHKCVSSISPPSGKDNDD